MALSESLNFVTEQFDETFSLRCIGSFETHNLRFGRETRKCSHSYTPLVPQQALTLDDIYEKSSPGIQIRIETFDCLLPSPDDNVIYFNKKQFQKCNNMSRSPYLCSIITDLLQLKVKLVVPRLTESMSGASYGPSRRFSWKAVFPQAYVG